MLNHKMQNVWHTLGTASLALAVALIFSAWHPDSPAQAQTPEMTAADTVEVSLGPDGMTLSEAPLTAGTITFKIANEGSSPHGFAIAGPVEKRLDGEVAAGETKTLNATLDPGSYTAHCPMEGHEKESTEFTVGR